MFQSAIVAAVALATTQAVTIGATEGEAIASTGIELA